MGRSMRVAKITSIRLKTGDVVAFEIEDDRVLMRKLAPGRDEYVKAVERALTEWTSPEDEAAWQNL